MSGNSASVKSMGGGGFTFADKVAASFLAQMLARTFPFGIDLGRITQLHFETRDIQNPIDDLLLILSRGGQVTEFSVSIKSNRQVAKSGFSADFVRDAWAQWNGSASRGDDPLTALVGIAVSQIDDVTLAEWDELQKQAAATTPARLVARLADNSGQSSAIDRALFKSLRHLGDTEFDPLETAKLISRLRIIHFSDHSEGHSLQLCIDMVVAGTEEEGRKLWSRLLHLAADGRGVGAHFDLPKLIRALKSEFALKHYPDYDADWKQLRAVSADNSANVRTVLGSGIHLTRSAVLAKITATIAEHSTTIVTGESGSGKSALVAQIAVADVGFTNVLWVNGRELSKASQTELAQSLRLHHSLPHLIAMNSQRGGLVVIDGFEQFASDARRRIGEILKGVREQDFLGWKVVVTCQPFRQPALSEVLIDAGVTDVETISVDKPAASEIAEAVQSLPNVFRLLARQELQQLLRNLMILDWVIRADIGQRFQTLDRPWIGETEILSYIWQRWMGEDPTRFARDVFLQQLGRQEGERLSGAVPISSIDPQQLGLLGTLADDGLIHVAGPAVQFSHDLMGDLARFRALVFNADYAAGTIVDLASVPRWGRAIRLFAQSLAEDSGNLDRWKAVAEQFPEKGENTQLARDLFLDGLLFATNATLLLDRVWPDLIGKEGQVLRRLLKRMMHIASLPDPRFRDFMDKKDTDKAESWFRIPNPIYWYPALLVMARHAEDVAKGALIPAAEACTLWLRTMPPEMPGRTEAATLALALAKELQGLIAEGVSFFDVDRVVCEALLYAALEFPDEVSEIALELARRRDEPEHATKRQAESRRLEGERHAQWIKDHPEEYARRKRSPLPPSFRGRMRPAAADGPTRQLPRGFQSAVLDTAAISPLTLKRPAIAREVLLAACIEEPTEIEYGPPTPWRLEHLGLAYWQSGYPPIYWKTPFLTLLQNSPENGIDAILRLIDYATNRWLEAAAGAESTVERRQLFGVSFDFPGGSKLWYGNYYVYAWYRNLGLHGEVVTCALMALEKWLYDEIDSDRDVTCWLEFICAQSSSLAFAGVLVTVGLKRPGLFTNALRPLVGSLTIYNLQRNLALNGRRGAWQSEMYGWANQGEYAFKLAVDWHRLPHRLFRLEDVVPRLMLFHRDTRSYLLQKKAEWQMELAAQGEPDDQDDCFLARFDPANYTVVSNPDGSCTVNLQWPSHLEERIEGTAEPRTLSMLALTLAQEARRYLSGEACLTGNQVGDFAARVRRLADCDPATIDEAHRIYRGNSIAGGLAALVVLHRQWLAEHPDTEHWVLQSLRDFSPVELTDDDTPESIMNTYAESFLGEAGIVLLLESAEDWVIRLAIGGLTGFHYNSTFFVMWRAYQLRNRLGARFDECVNAVILWSALRAAAVRQAGGHQSVLARYRESVTRRFKAGRLSGPPSSIKVAARLSHHLKQRIERRLVSEDERRARQRHERYVEQRRERHKIYREWLHLDMGIITAGFGFLKAMMKDTAPSDFERAGVYIQRLFDAEMESLPVPPDDGHYEIEGTPYHFDRWVLDLAAEYSSFLPPQAARHFYEPVLRRGPAARYWVEDFLHSWIVAGLPSTPNRVQYVETWVAMIEYAHSLALWKAGRPGYWYTTETLAIDLVGLHKEASAVLGSISSLDIVRAMAPSFETWAGAWVVYARPAAWYGRFLATESGRILLPSGIKQLASAVDGFQERDWQHEGLAETLSEALVACWSELNNRMERDSVLRQAFLRILTALCNRQVSEAIYLRAKVSGTLSV
jgi:hypothetical protein